MSNAGAVVGAIAAHTVITSTIRNQQEAPPEENTMTDEELSQAAHDTMATLIRQAYWGMGIMVAVVGLFALLVYLTN